MSASYAGPCGPVETMTRSCVGIAETMRPRIPDGDAPARHVHQLAEPHDRHRVAGTGRAVPTRARTMIDASITVVVSSILAGRGFSAPPLVRGRGRDRQRALLAAVLLGVEDGVVATQVVGLEDLGGVVVVPAATFGQVAEGEPPPGRQGDGGAAGAVAAWLQRVREGIQPLKSPTTETLPAMASVASTKLTLTALRWPLWPGLAPGAERPIAVNGRQSPTGPVAAG